MQSAEVEAQRCGWWTASETQSPVMNDLVKKTVTWNSLMTTYFPSFILMLLLSGKCVLRRDQRVSSNQDSRIQEFQATRFFQALKQSWMWVRAEILLDWERQLKNNTRDFSEKKAYVFPLEYAFSKGEKILARKSSLFSRCDLLSVVMLFMDLSW